jgi:protein disulfide-isomerase A1
MDATENDIPPQAPFRVQGFPTLKFRPAGSSEFIDYNGDRSLESLIEFVEEHKTQSGASKRDVEEEEDDVEVPEHDEL